MSVDTNNGAFSTEEWLHKLCREVEGELHREHATMTHVRDFAMEPFSTYMAGRAPSSVLTAKLFAARVVKELSMKRVSKDVEHVGVAMRGTVVDLFFSLRHGANTTRNRFSIYEVLSKVNNEPVFDDVRFDFMVTGGESCVPEGYDDILMAGA